MIINSFPFRALHSIALSLNSHLHVIVASLAVAIPKGMSSQMHI